MGDNEALIEQFKAISGVDSERAKFYLESAAWNIESALSSFYEGSEDPDPIEVDTPEVEPPLEKGDDMPRVLAESSDESSSEEEGQAFYAGGSVHSGQQVIGAGKKKKKNVVSKLFKSAKAHGAEVVEDKEKPGKGKKINFHGTGYRLGETENDHEVVAQSSQKGKSDKPRDVVLGMWKTGFTVDNGPMRPYEDPANMEFLNSVRRGQVPLELIREAKGGEVFINMEDHRHEEYVTPKLNLKAFSGSGQTLGSICPTVVGQVTNTGMPGGSSGKTVIVSKPSDPSACEAKAKEDLNVDSSQPTTNIQLRLPDGSRLVVKANHTHTVGHLRSYARTARDTLPASFAIMMTFPYTELTEDSLTLSDAKLLNAALVLKPK